MGRGSPSKFGAGAGRGEGIVGKAEKREKVLQEVFLITCLPIKSASFILYCHWDLTARKGDEQEVGTSVK